MIKIADKISNIKSIKASPPLHWSEERKQEYIDWAKEVVKGCKGSSTILENTFYQAIGENL